MKFAAIILLLVVVGIRALAASRSATNLTAQQRVETERLEAMHETRLRFAREGSIMKAHARPDLTTPDLLELLALDDAEFKRRFAGTPMLRTKRCCVRSRRSRPARATSIPP